MNKNLIGELAVMDGLKIKPNYAALAREHGMDWRTIKKYHEGYEGKPSNRNKSSKLDEYRQEIADKLTIHRITVRGVYNFMVKKYGLSRIGTYSNFNKYIQNNKLKPKAQTQGHPRFEKNPGEQAQIDWKEDISIANKYGEIFVVNILHAVLKFSRFNHIELSVFKRFDDVARCIINAFKHFGGVPDELLFDNMSTVANINAKPKKPTDAIRHMAKDFGFKVRLCKVRAAQTKGTVEAKNKMIDWLRAYEGEFETIDELISIVESINQDMNITINQETQMSPTALFYKEKEYLQPLPSKDIIDTYLRPNKYKVSEASLIRFGESKYSVDPKLIGEEVTVDVLDNKLYIYYNGKLSTFHSLNKKPINYKENHYKKLMEGKVKETDMEVIVTNNLEMMDKLLEIRKLDVSEIAATKSAEALIAYINQSEYGKWVINNFAHLSAVDRIIFITGINEVLPYVGNRENFISHIKYSMKDNLCQTIAFDCLVNDLMAYSTEECILSDDGYETLKERYRNELDKFINEMTRQHELEEKEESERITEYKKLKPADANALLPIISENELPFKERDI